MVRISAIFIAVCMVLIAASLAVVAYLRFGFTGVEAAVVGLAGLAALAVYNIVSTRLRDRAQASAQISTLSRNSGDLARQLGEFGLRLNAMESRVDQVLQRTLETAQPLAAELEELSGLVKQLADSVAAHEIALAEVRTARQMEAAGGHGGAALQRAAATEPAVAPLAASAPVAADVVPTPPPPVRAPEPAPVSVAPVSIAPARVAPPERTIPAFAGLGRDGVIGLIRQAVDGGKIDLYLQPIVMLPQRKVRFYEALSRLKVENGDVVAAGDFLKYAEAGSLVPKLDHLSVMRCVQVVRRLLLKNRDIGLFCNVSGATLTDASFTEFLEFVEANRAIAASLVFELSQSAVRAMGPIEHESLAALAERGFRFSMDNLTDLRVEPRELTDRGFRYVKVPAALLLNRAGAASTDIHPADLSDLLGRYGIDLIADRIETENTVVDLLDYDVRYGQGFLFAPPRPVRAEALQGANGDGAKDAARSDTIGQSRNAGALAGVAATKSEPVPAAARMTLAQLVRAGASRS